MKIIILFLCALVAFAGNILAGGQEGLAALDRGDYQAAYKEFKSLADQGDTRSMIQIGLLYHQGQGFKQDYAKAMEWYLKAFEKNNGDALSNIGVMYRDGLGVEKNLQIAFALFWITHWAALGTEDTQYRAGANLEKTARLMKKEEIEETLKITQEYVRVYVRKQGKLEAKEEALKFAKDGHPIKALAELTSSASEDKSLHLVCELRLPKGTILDTNTAIDLVTEGNINGTPVHFMKRTEAGAYITFSESFLIGNEGRRALVVSFRLTDDPHIPSQVFVLPAPAKPADWTEWQKPNYTEKSDAMWSFMHDLKNADRSKEIPAGCFELRYKVEK